MELLFRAWDWDKKEMVYGLIISGGRVYLNYDDFEYYIPCRFPVMQHVGLLDDDRIPIYEGDIVSNGFDYGAVYNEDYMYLVRTSSGKVIPLSNFCFASTFHVIGNVWEDIELRNRIYTDLWG